MSYYPSVIQAVAGPNQTVYAYFTDGSVRQFDVKPLIERGGVFSVLVDEEVFRDRLTVMNDTVAWDISGDRDPSKCIDLDPFSVYESSEIVDDPLATVA